MRCRHDQAQNSLIGASSHAEAALGVNGHRVRAARFGMNLQAVPVRIVAEEAVMVVNREVAERLAVVSQKAVALLPAVDDAAGHHRQERQQVVAAALPKLLPQAWASS